MYGEMVNKNEGVNFLLMEIVGKMKKKENEAFVQNWWVRLLVQVVRKKWREE